MARAGIVVAGLDGFGIVDGGLFADADVPVPIDLDLELASSAGRVQVISGGGSIAGFPAGPLAELITSAIVVRL